MASGERVVGYNPNHTEVSKARIERMNEVFPGIEELVRQGLMNRLGIADSPIDIHGHDNGSAATYVTKFTYGDHVVRASFLDENEETSKAHLHRWPAGRIPPREISSFGGSKVDVAELYIVLDGEAELILDENDEKPVVLNKENPSYTVHSGTLHRVRTKEKPALMLLLTSYEALLDPSEVHIRPNEFQRPGNAILPLDEAR